MSLQPCGAFSTLVVRADVAETSIRTLTVELVSADPTGATRVTLIVHDGVVSGGLPVVVGLDRELRLSAFDSLEVETHRARTTLDIACEGPTEHVQLTPLASDPAVRVAVGNTVVFVTPPGDTLVVNQTVQLSAKLLGAAATGVRWASLDRSVATVNSAGTVLGVWEGDAVIVASASGAADSTTVTVAPVRTRVIRRFVIHDGPGHYAFPDVEWLNESELAVVYRHGTEHVDPSGRLLLTRLSYQGDTLAVGSTEVLIDTDDDDREASIAVLSDGTVLVNFFRSQDYLLYEQGIRLPEEPGEDVPPPATAILRSFDGGRSWEEPIAIKSPLSFTATSDAILELPSGVLLLPVYGPVHGDAIASAHLFRSTDGGRVWKYGARLARDGTGRTSFVEPALALVATPTWPSGRRAERVIATLRSDLDADGVIFQTYSSDDGITWSPVAAARSAQARRVGDPGSPSVPGGGEQIDVWGFPQHISVLRSGLVLMSYGYRRPPFGVRYRLSRSGGAAWMPFEGVLEARGDGGDVGYPSTVELPDGSLLTVYYWTEKGRTVVSAVRYLLG